MTGLISDKNSLDRFLDSAMKGGIVIARPEELALIKEVQDGVLWLKVRTGRDSSGRKYREKRYKIRRKSSRNACDRLFRAHYRFVFQIASRYAYKGMPMGDAFQAGLLGLQDAIVRFDLKHHSHIRLLSYAKMRIHQVIQREFPKSNSNHMVRIPVHVVFAIHRARKVMQEVMRRGGEMGEYYDEILEKTEMVLGGKHKEIARYAVDSLYTGRDTSLDAPASDDDDAPRYQMFKSDIPTPQEELLAHEREDQLRRALHKLSPVEEVVMKYRLAGLTLEVIGEKIAERGLTNAKTSKITRERARQIEEKALQKLVVILREMGARE